MKKKNIATTIIVIITSYTIFAILLPFIFKYVIFENTSFSNLSNNEWAGFLGSYVGGILGGLGTLLSLSITVKESRNMQAENKRDTDQKILNDRAEREQEKKTARLEDAKKERNYFTEDIAVYIGKYITDISKYYYAIRHSEQINTRYNDIFHTLNELDQQILKINKTLDQLIPESSFTSSEFIQLDLKRQHLLENQHIWERKYAEISKERDQNSQDGNRLKANECYFILRTKLYNIAEASNLLYQLKFMHNELFVHLDYSDLKENWIGENSDLLIKEFYDFKLKYINKH